MNSNVIPWTLKNNSSTVLYECDDVILESQVVYMNFKKITKKQMVQELSSSVQLCLYQNVKE